MATTAFISEYRSMTFKCKASVSSSVEFSEINNYPEANHMAPQQLSHQEMMHKSSDRIPDSEQSRENPESPISSPGTSSSSPVLPGEEPGRGVNHEYVLRGSSIVDPSSDDSESMPNDMSGYHGDQDEFPSPLEQLKCALEKNGMLGQKLNLPNYDPSKENNIGRNGESMVPSEEPCIYYDNNELYKCHLCSYTGNSKHEFNMHMNSHFDHKCQYCDYTSRTEGRLKRHIKDFHSTTPPESWAGTRVPRTDGSGGEQSMDDSVSSSGTGKSRTYRCKQCNFVAYKKNEFWSHHKKHIKAEKLLTCPQCEFVTEYKHHLEYHIRNHFGSKPFKCNKCNYSCVNKSMLNSHMKSHSNIYQYRCANCTYATKYCHSLKLHLRKYDHKPATVLNMDGTPNPYPVIDVYGTRRGPRTKKRKLLDESENIPVSSSAVISSPQSMNYSSVPPLLPPNVPVMYHPQFYNGYHGNIFMRPPTQLDNNSNALSHVPHFGPKHGSPLKCLICDFVTDIQEVFHKHMILHAASENQDLVKLYGINSDSILHFQDQQLSHYSQKQRHYLENSPSNDASYSIQDREPEISDDRNERDEPMKEINVKDEEKGGKQSPFEKIVASPNVVSKNKDYAVTEDRVSRSQEMEVEDIYRNDDIEPCTSSSPNSHQQQVEISSSTKSESPVVKNADHSPLDLSSSKHSGQRVSETHSGQRLNETQLESRIPRDDVNQAARIETSSAQCHSRNRRKGKAFKIDRNVQYEDHTKEFSNHSLNQDTYEDNYQNDSKGSYILRENSMHPLNSNQPSTHSQNYPAETSRSLSPKNKKYGSGEGVQSHQDCAKHDSGSNSNAQKTAKVSNSQSFKSTSTSNDSNDFSDVVPLVPKIEIDVEDETNSRDLKWSDIYVCPYCDIAFKKCVLYTMHMGYHGYADPFTCNMCGQVSKDEVDFSLHILRTAHM